MRHQSEVMFLGTGRNQSVDEGFASTATSSGAHAAVVHLEVSLFTGQPFGMRRAVYQVGDGTMKALQLLNEYEAYRSYALRAKRLGRTRLVKSFQEKAIYTLNTLELVLGCRLHCI